MTKNKMFSTVGMAYFLMALITLGVTNALALIIANVAPRVYYLPVMDWVISLAPLYLLGMPVCKKCMEVLPKVRLFRARISFGKWFKILCICLCVMYAGNIIGNLVTTLLGNATNLNLDFALEDLMMSDRPAFVFLFSVILAPILEELIFRKVLIDRMIVFGDKAAILLSGFLFGLFHGNLYQLFYAFGLGCVLAYVYIRTGNIKYTISLHMAINFLGGFVSTLILRNMDLSLLSSEDLLNDTYVLMQFAFQNLGAILAYIAFLICMIVLSILGLVWFLMSIKKLRFYPGEYSAPSREMAGYMFKNVGMWLFIGVCVVMFILNML